MNALYGVPGSEIASVWNAIEPQVAAACEYNGSRYNANDCLAELLNGEKQLWLVKNSGAIRGIVITAIANFPQMKCCTIDICTGEGLEEWKHLLAIIEAWAKGNECQQMFFVARAGMQKALKEQGYLKTHVFLEKKI